MQADADRHAADAPDPMLPERDARSGRGVVRRGRALLGGLTLTGFVLAEMVCIAVLVTAALVAAL
jgi:hypothetical protein